MSKVTIISALFNIQRENVDGRTWEEYLKWFDITLKLKCPMILYVSKDVRQFVEEKRLKIPTDIFVQEIDEIPYYYLKEKIDSIIESENYKNIISDPDRIECKHSMYSIIQFSKFKWLENAIENNIFGSEYFFWIDAGASRFFEDFDLNSTYPSESAIEALQEMGEKFLIQKNTECYPDLVFAEKLNEDYLLDNRSFISGTFFGGHKNIIPEVSKKVDDLFIGEMINNGYINNEQIALGYLLKNNEELFECYERENWKQIGLFLEMSK